MKIAGCNKERGFQNGPHNLAKFRSPWGIILNPNDGCLYISDTGNNCIRVIDKQGIMNFTQFQSLVNFHVKFLLNSEVRTFVGQKGEGGFFNGQGVDALFHTPFQIAYSSKDRSLLVSDYRNRVIRKVTMNGNKEKETTTYMNSEFFLRGCF